ncbi:MAG TPA: 50S ribosomal protein L11 methyltransferase, partial [Nitrosopumilaceae archaeon]|nr:50S ribosomal protein L11 methyltransferase [Nitrosopumilaceae archaeon]
GEALFGLSLLEKKILDMGCGTGVLAILAKKLGAKEIVAIDIDEWSYENTLENIELNKIQGIQVKIGDRDLLKGEYFDIILANINRNVLLNDMEIYSGCLNTGGIILFSGFFESDIPEMEKKAVSVGLKFISSKIRNDWACIQYRHE